jgi:avirulence protein
VTSTDPTADRESPFYSSLRDAGLWEDGEPFHIEHTAPSEVPRIMAHAESLYSRALDPSVSDPQALTTLGELHWWVAHAMPDDRGSAAKTELSVRSMAQSLGMDLPSFKKGFVPDLEAMTTPRSEFTAKYPAMFDWKSAPRRSGE